MLYNRRYVMLYYRRYVMLCYITYVMLCYVMTSKLYSFQCNCENSVLFALRENYKTALIY